MTHLPTESWNVKPFSQFDKGDGEYELNTIDARPGSSEPATEAHHLWRRSFTNGPCWWVQFPDGIIAPNVVGLSRHSHQELEREHHRIVYQDGIFYWVTPEEYLQAVSQKLNIYETADWFGHPLDPQPGPHEPLPHEHTSVVQPGNTCPTCHRRVPHPKTKKSPPSERVTFRLPADEKKAHDEVMVALAEHVGVKGTKYERFNAYTKAIYRALQAPPEDF